MGVEKEEGLKDGDGGGVGFEGGGGGGQTGSQNLVVGGDVRKSGGRDLEAGENQEGGSVVDASGSPSDGAEEKQGKRKRDGGGSGASISAAKRQKVDGGVADGQSTPAVSAPSDQVTGKGSSRRSSRAVAQQEKKPSSSSAKLTKPRVAAANNNVTKKSPKSSGDQPTRKEIGTLDEYRDLRLRLEKIRHSGVYEGEKRHLYSQMLVKWNYDYEVRLADDEFEAARRLLTQRLLQENMEHQRRVEELRYKIVRDDPNGMWQRRHEMSLRGRNANTAGSAGPGGEVYHGSSGQAANSEADVISGDANNHERGTSSRNSRRRVSIDRARVRVELDAVEVMDDLAEIIGEKRNQTNADTETTNVNSRRTPNPRSTGRNRRLDDADQTAATTTPTKATSNNVNVKVESNT